MQLVLADDSFAVLGGWRHRYSRNYNNYEYNQ